MTNPDKPIIQTDSSVPIHDGIVQGEEVWFTSVNGSLIKSSMETGEVVDVFDLQALREDELAVGWCRGLTFVEKDKVLVGFTRLRPTKFRKNVRWIKHRLGLRSHVDICPSRLGLYDLSKRELIRDYNVEDVDMAAVFTIHLADK